MNENYPSSILISLYCSLILSFSHFFFGVSLGHPISELLYSQLFFFLLSLFLITFVIEVFIYRKLKNLTARGEEEIKKLKEMETFRREFLGDVSHELKTPIFAIMGFLETLLDGAISDTKVSKRFLSKAMKHSKRLSNLVQDILILTQLESGDMKLFISKFDIIPLLKETIDSLDVKFSAKKVKIFPTLLFDDNFVTKVVGDKDRIQQVLYNLLENAIKYGADDGKIEVDVEEWEDKYCVKIQDFGPGIEPKHLNRIFERFYRVDKSRSREKGGTGLGLAICRNFLEAHGERIWVESELGKGSVFQFTLRKENAGTEE